MHTLDLIARRGSSSLWSLRAALASKTQDVAQKTTTNLFPLMRTNHHTEYDEKLWELLVHDRPKPAKAPAQKTHLANLSRIVLQKKSAWRQEEQQTVRRDEQRHQLSFYLKADKYIF